MILIRQKIPESVFNIKDKEGKKLINKVTEIFSEK